MALPEGLTSFAWVAAATVVAPTAFGYGIVRWLGLAPAHGLRFTLAFGYLVGHYVLSHVTLAWLLLGQPVPGLLLPLGAAFAGILLLRRARRRHPEWAPWRPAPWWSWLPVLLLVVLLVDNCTAVDAQLIRYSDEAVNWAAKAKVLYGAHGADLGTGLAFYVEHPDYPLFNPLVQVLSFASAGRVLHWENRLPVQFFGVALLLLLSASLHRRAHAIPATLALIAFASTSFDFLAPTAYADVMLAMATLAAAEALLRWRETGERVCFGLAAIAMGAMIATKNEGVVLAMAVAAPFAAERALVWWRTRQAVVPLGALPWLLVPVAAVVLQRAFNAWFAIKNDLFDPSLGKGQGLFARILDQLPTYGPQVARYYGKMLVDPALHRLLPLLFLIATPIALGCSFRQRIRGAGALLFGAFLLATGGYALVFIGTIYDLQWHLDVAADRTMQHVLPLVVVGLCAIVWPREGVAVTTSLP